MYIPSGACRWKESPWLSNEAGRTSEWTCNHPVLSKTQNVLGYGSATAHRPALPVGNPSQLIRAVCREVYFLSNILLMHPHRCYIRLKSLDSQLAETEPTLSGSTGLSKDMFDMCKKIWQNVSTLQLCTFFCEGHPAISIGWVLLHIGNGKFKYYRIGKSLQLNRKTLRISSSVKLFLKVISYRCFIQKGAM